MAFSRGLGGRHKVFVSYYHRDDQEYRDKFEQSTANLFIFKSVRPGDIESDLSDEYVKRLIQEEYISDSSVVVVLVGPRTFCRKHVDWEISAGLNRKVNGYSGLVGIVLPTFPLSADNEYDPKLIPPRLNDNLVSKFAKLYAWGDALQSDETIIEIIETAFQDRIRKSGLIRNDRLQYARDICQ